MRQVERVGTKQAARGDGLTTGLSQSLAVRKLGPGRPGFQKEPEARVESN